MKVSIQLAQQFSNVDITGIPTDTLLERIGAQLGAVEDVVYWGARFEGATVVRVMSCEAHPNADTLQVCRIDDGGTIKDIHRGEDGYIQVVCGAPNVREGMIAVWLPVGTTVPNTRESDPFVLTAREIRGVTSYGMLASAHELGISDDHDGIVELTANQVGRELRIGDPFSAYCGLDDVVIDCENKMFTHRPDCFGNIGVARELAGISDMTFRSPDWYLADPQFETAQEHELHIQNEIPELVPRFMAVVLQNITVTKSPLWLQATLMRIGIKPINNVVDVTNYVMHLTGQPMHAFDYAKLQSLSNKPSLQPRLAQPGEEITLLGQKTIKLTGDEIVISTDKQAVALAGVMGGVATEVDEHTNTIVLEVATFDMFRTRRTSMMHGLFTDAATRYTKGQSPLQNAKVLWYAMQQLKSFAGAQQSSSVYDVQPRAAEQRRVQVPLRYINERLGTELTPVDITRLLKHVEFGTDVRSDQSGTLLLLDVPFWRMDIEHPEDIVEEVGRLYGYHRLPVVPPVRPAKPTETSQLIRVKREIREKLRAYGANELLTYSFVHGDLMRRTNTDPEKWAYHIRNAISPDLQYYRTALVPSLLAKVHPNLKAQAGSSENHFALFELSKIHIKGHVDEDGLPIEHDRLALVIAADDKTARAKYAGAAYYHAAHYIRALTKDGVQFRPLTDDTYPISSAYQLDRSALVYSGETLLGIVGEFKQSVKKNLKLPDYCAAFELDIQHLQELLHPQQYVPLSTFPASQQDLTLETDNSVTYGALVNALKQGLDESAEQHGYDYHLEPKSLYVPEDQEIKRFTFTVSIQHHARTLTTQEVSQLVEDIAEVAATAVQARRV